MLTMSTLMIAAALVAALVLLVRHRPAALPVLALVVAGIEALIAFHLIHLTVARVPVSAVLGAALTVAGVACWVKAGARSTITAATVVALVGAVQTVSALHLLHG